MHQTLYIMREEGLQREEQAPKKKKTLAKQRERHPMSPTANDPTTKVSAKVSEMPHRHCCCSCQPSSIAAHRRRSLAAVVPPCRCLQSIEREIVFWEFLKLGIFLFKGLGNKRGERKEGIKKAGKRKRKRRGELAIFFIFY